MKRVDSADFARIQQAFEAADVAQDVAPLEAVLDPQVAWAAKTAGPGNCHSREEVLGIWRAGIAQGIVGHIAEFKEVRGRILFVLRRENLPPGQPVLGTHILSVHHGLVIQIQDYETPDEALQALEPNQLSDS
ncbi:MAG: hypothetical protein WBR23_00885 [Candidatus Dormiibacterota bacterium]